MTSRLYVGNLAYSTTPDELRALFAECGEVVDVSMPTDASLGRPRGFAFVAMATAEQGAAAVSRLDGSTLGGRSLRVNPAQERGDSSGAPERFSAPRPPPPRARPKGSRRNVRARKRGF